MTDEPKETKKIILSQRLAGFLMYDGFVLHAMEPHRDGSGRHVFIFRDSPELNAAIGRYKRR